MPDKQPLKPDQLGALYPKVKTYDEIVDERAAVHKLKESQAPKLIPLRIGLMLTWLTGLVALLVWLAPILVQANVMTGIFASFGILLVITWFGWRIISRIDYLYYTYGTSARHFFVSYFIFLGCLVAALHYLGWGSVTRDITSIAVIVTLHLVLASGLAWLMQRISALTSRIGDK